MRMRPLSDIYPKPLLYLPGGTLLDYLLAHLRHLPLDEVAIILHPEEDRMERHLARSEARRDVSGHLVPGGDGVRLRETPGLKLIPQQPPFTLLGALASAADWVRGLTLVVHADSYFSTPLHYFLHPFVKGQSRTPTFLVGADGPPGSRSLGRAQAGAYVLPPEAFQIAGSIADADSLLALSAELAVRGIERVDVPVRGWHCNVDEPTDLLALNRHLLTHWHEAAVLLGAHIGYDPMSFSWIALSADVDVQRMGLYVTVGENAVVRDSHLHNCLVFPGVSLAGAEEENTILVEDQNTCLHIYAGHGRSQPAAFF